MGIFTLANSPSRLKGVGALPCLINYGLSTIFFCPEVLGGLIGETSGYDNLFRIVRFFFSGASTVPFSGVFSAALFSGIFSADGLKFFLVSTTFFVSIAFLGDCLLSFYSTYYTVGVPLEWNFRMPVVLHLQLLHLLLFD
jgi:hypothetical protein